MTTPRRGDFSLADLLIAAHTLGAAPGTLASFLEPRPSTPDAGPPPGEPSGDRPAAGREQRAPDRPRPDHRPAAGHGAAGAADDLVVTTVPPDPAKPAWWSGAEPVPVSPPAPAESSPEPPIPAHRARPALARLARLPRRGPQIDLAALLGRAARAEPLTPAPLAGTLRIPPSVALLVDIGEGMEPYRADVRFLRRQIASVVGPAALSAHTFVGDPLRGVDPDRYTRETRPWPGSRPGELVVVLSDLGVGGPPLSPDRSAATAWRAVAELIGGTGGQAVALTPFPARRAPAGLPASLRVVGWDEIERFRRHDR